MGGDPAELAQAAIALAKSGRSSLAHQTLASLEPHAMQADRETLQWIAAAYHALKCHGRALLFARRAADGSTEPTSMFFQATLELFSGNSDKAEHMLESCIRSAPGMGSAHWTLAKIRRQTGGNNHIDRLRRQIREQGDGDSALPYLFFALFKELDDIGEVLDAWQALVHGCLSWRRPIRYEVTRDLAGMQGLARAFPQSPILEPPKEGANTPIFIVGLPRSGTTVVERILAGHSAVSACGELDDLPTAMILSADGIYFDVPTAADSQKIAGSDLSVIAQHYRCNTTWRADGRPMLTDKRPNNFLYVGAIQRAMPGAKIIHVHKQPVAACFSLLKEFFGGRYNYSYKLNELAAYHDHYRRLMQHWRDSGHEFLDVSYEQLVSEPESEARRILAYCGLDWQEQCLHTERQEGAIATASVTQARAPVSGEYVDAWVRYAPRLEALQDMLAQ